MKTRYYHILDKDNNIIYVGLTTTTIGQRFCRHIISKHLNRVDYKCVQIDEIDNGDITSLEDYYREKKRAAELEKYYIDKARKEGANLMNISKGGEWNSHVLENILKEDFFKKYGTYEGYKKYVKHQLYTKKKYRMLLRHWYYESIYNPYRRRLNRWVKDRARPKYKKLLQQWYHHHSENKYKKFLSHWYHHHSENKYKRFIRHWWGHRIENPYKKLWEYRVRRKTRNRYKHLLQRLIVRRTSQVKEKALKDQGLYKKNKKNIYKQKLKDWVRYKTMNPYKRIWKQLISYRNHQERKRQNTN